MPDTLVPCVREPNRSRIQRSTQSQTAPRSAEPTSLAYLARAPVGYRGSGADQALEVCGLRSAGPRAGLDGSSLSTLVQMVGAGIGVLSWFTWLISKKAIGCSTSFARTAGMIEKLFRGKQVEEKPYYQEVKPVVDWQWMLVAGMVAGALVSSLLSGDFALQWVPARWAAAFGTSALVRVIAALAGGILLGFGARWAGGCTSGHGISGTMQMAVSSWISAICFFVGGIVMAQLLFAIIA